MTRFDRTLKELGDLYEMYRVIRQYKLPRFHGNSLENRIQDLDDDVVRQDALDDRRQKSELGSIGPNSTNAIRE